MLKFLRGNTFIISHIDADGITSASILYQTYERMRDEVHFTNIKQLESHLISNLQGKIKQYSPDNVIFSDLGSGQIDVIWSIMKKFEGTNLIILDHHQPKKDYRKYENLLKEGREFYHYNSFLLGYDGGIEISGSGLSYLYSMSASESNVDLGSLAITGAVGDMQNKSGKLIGVNRKILSDLEKKNIVRSRLDLAMFGIETKPLHVMLQYSSPYIPGITGVKSSSMRTIDEMGISQKEGDRWRTWTDLDEVEKSIFIIEMNKLYKKHNLPPLKMVEVYELLNWYEKTETRYAKEFSTLLNATGRNDNAELGVRLCNRDYQALKEAGNLLTLHRRNLSRAIALVQSQGVIDFGNFYLFRTDKIKETIIGIVIGMALGSKLIPDDKPVFGVVQVGDVYKISARESASLSYNLKKIIEETTEVLNNEAGRRVSEGGGHKRAAGLFVEKECFSKFLYYLNKILESKR